MRRYLGGSINSKHTLILTTTHNLEHTRYQMGLGRGGKPRGREANLQTFILGSATSNGVEPPLASVWAASKVEEDVGG